MNLPRTLKTIQKRDVITMTEEKNDIDLYLERLDKMFKPMENWKAIFWQNNLPVQMMPIVVDGKKMYETFIVSPRIHQEF